MGEALVAFEHLWSKFINVIFNQLIIGDGVSLGFIFIAEMVTGILLFNLAPIAQTREWIHDIITRKRG